MVSSENCWPDPIVASVAGAARSVGLVMSKIGVACWKPGEVERGMERGGATGHDVFRAGEHDGRSPRVTGAGRELKVVDGSRATDNLWGERWSKLCANCHGQPVQAMSGLGCRDRGQRGGGRAITIRMARSRPRSASSRATDPQVQRRHAEQWADSGRPRRTTPLDAMLTPKSASQAELARLDGPGRPQGTPTEIDYMNGYVVDKGRELASRPRSPPRWSR